MKRTREIERMVRDLRHPVDPGTHRRTLKRLLGVLRQHERSRPAAGHPHAERTIMRSPIAKLSIVAAIFVAVLGSFHFACTGRQAGVLWAEVPERIDRATGCIRRIRETWAYREDGRIEEECKVCACSPAYGYRMDYYEDNRIVRQRYLSAVTRESVSIDHERKTYHYRQYDPEPWRWKVKENFERDLETDGRSLGRRRIDGREAEGFEFTPERGGKEVAGDCDWVHIWVDVSTGLPILLEDVMTADDGTWRCHAIEDRWLWNVEFDPNEFVPPEMPDDYELYRRSAQRVAPTRISTSEASRPGPRYPASSFTRKSGSGIRKAGVGRCRLRE